MSGSSTRSSTLIAADEGRRQSYQRICELLSGMRLQRRSTAAEAPQGVLLRHLRRHTCSVKRII